MKPPLIRPETLEDSAAVRALYDRNLPDSPEGNIVQNLRRQCLDYQGWVAIAPTGRREIIGHVLLTPVTLKPHDYGEALTGVALVPLVVDHAWRNQGYGSELVHHALTTARFMHQHFVVTLGGIPEYFQRFGFMEAVPWGIECEYGDIPQENLMINLLEPDGLGGKTGTVYYRPEFREKFARAAVYLPSTYR